MELRYFKKRRTGGNPELLEEYYKLLADCYTEKWLDQNDGNLIQRLWKRPDELAVAELYSLAVSIKTMLALNSKWTLYQIEQTKSSEKNHSRGAIFEINCLAMLHNPKHPVRTVGRTQSGYDGILEFGRKKDLRVSIKNYGISEAQKNFSANAKKVEQYITELLNKYDYPPVTIVIDSPQGCPQDKDWEMLLARLGKILKEKRNATDPFYALVTKIDNAKDLSPDNAITKWIVLISPFKGEETISFHPAYKSYSLIVTGRYYQNEYANIYSKITKACQNLEAYSANESDEFKNCLFLHIPPTVSIDTCYKWVDNYFEQNPATPISLVILYQPSVAIDNIRNITFLHHFYRVLFRSERLAGWLVDGLNLNVNFPCGQTSEEPILDKMMIEYPDGSSDSYTIEDRYIYQHGEHYIKMQPDGMGGFEGHSKKIGQGIYTSMVLEIPGQPGSAAITQRQPPDDELLIL